MNMINDSEERLQAFFSCKGTGVSDMYVQYILIIVARSDCTASDAFINVFYFPSSPFFCAPGMQTVAFLFYIRYCYK